KNSIFKAFDGYAWLMQIVLFLTLGLLVFPSQVLPYMGIGLLISVFLIFVARPVSVFLCLIFFKMDLNRKFYISWVGLRGAVPIVFATYPLLAGIDKANMIFNIVFFIAASSVLIQGTSLPLVAKWLKVSKPEESKEISDFDKLILDFPKSSLKEIKVFPKFLAVNKRIVDLNFPKSAFIVMIKRKGVYIRPGGSTQIEANDVLMVLADSPEDFTKVNQCLEDPGIMQNS
ncbi:MAG TPA: potassium/proton antiporter, partial [Bacillus bacterium]|nr:potassium/proton antiporter [Bacillus sp. (in: firmicutes)]